MQKIQKSGEQGELCHKHEINKIQTASDATVMGIVVSNAGLMPRALQEINYKENKGMEGHCKLRETQKQIKMVKTKIMFRDARRDYYKSSVRGYFEGSNRMEIIMGTWRNFWAEWQSSIS